MAPSNLQSARLRSRTRTSFAKASQACRGGRRGWKHPAPQLRDGKAVRGEAKVHALSIDKIESTGGDDCESVETSGASPGAWRNPQARETPYQTLPEMWEHLAATLPADTVAVVDENNGKGEGIRVEWTYQELRREISLFAWGLRSLGAQKGQTTCIFSENSARWLVADQGSSMLGLTNALRGITSPPEELSYIVENSQGSGIIVQNQDTLDTVWPTLVEKGQHLKLGFVIVLWDGITDERRAELASQTSHCEFLSYQEVISRGTALSSATDADVSTIRDPSISEADPYCIIYTSGTTGQPKGAVLSHKNLMYQVINLHNVIAIPPKTHVISLLPPWHVYQLATSYYSYSLGITARYSNVANFRNDLADHGSDFIVAVPLVIENLYKKVMQTIKKMPSAKRALVNFFLGASATYIQATRVVEGVSIKYAMAPPPFAKMVAYWVMHLLLKPIHALASAIVYKKIREQIKIKRTIVSGGGALSDHLEDFFEIVGVEIINGWGLTETSPVIAARACATNYSYRNSRGTVGKPVPGTEVRAVNPETMADVEDGTKGLLLAKGATVFEGYKSNPAATKKAFRYGDGWFDTGDLGYIIPERAHHKMGGMIALVGREKETIVLSNGENVEPSPLEQACLASPFIEQIMVVGQDKKSLGAVVVPDFEALVEAQILSASEAGAESAHKSADLEAFLKKEIKAKIEERDLFKPQESVRQIAVLSDPLTFEDGFLTRTMKVRRHIVADRYAREIENMFQ